MLGLWSKNVLRWPSGLDGGFVTFSYDEDETSKTEGTQSVALYSDDLNNWSSTNLNVPITWNHVCYFNNEFIAFGGNFSLVSSRYWEVMDAYIAYSKDGKTWDVQKYNNNATGSGLKFAKDTLARTVSSASHNGVLVVSGSKTGIAWTTDGRNWTHFQHEGDVQMYGRDVIYAQDKFVRLGSGKLNWWSSDGGTWNTFATSLDGSSSIYMAFGNDVWVAFNGKGQYARSTNGTSWSSTNSISMDSSNYESIRGITFNKGFFLLCVEGGTSNGWYTLFYRSTDGINWERFRREGSLILQRITYNDQFLSVSSNAPCVIESSPDGINWTTIGEVSGQLVNKTELGKVGFPG
jgi:hypothetical protein